MTSDPRSDDLLHDELNRPIQQSADTPPPKNRDVYRPESEGDPGESAGSEEATESDDAANEKAGKAKRKWAEATDDERLETEGKRQELEAEVGEPADRKAREDAERDRRESTS